MFFFYGLHRIPRIHSLPLIAVRPSISSFHCTVLDYLGKVPYSLACILRLLHADLSPLSCAYPHFPSTHSLTRLPPVVRPLSQVPYPASPLFSTLTPPT